MDKWTADEFEKLKYELFVQRRAILHLMWALESGATEGVDSERFKRALVELEDVLKYLDHLTEVDTDFARFDRGVQNFKENPTYLADFS